MGHLSGLQEFLDEQCLSRMDFEALTGESVDNYEGLTYWQIYNEVFSEDRMLQRLMEV